MKQKTYRVKAVWRTLQGEGTWTGRAAVFVRLVACNMWTGREEDRERDARRNGAACPLWCDTNFTKAGSRALTAQELLKLVVYAAGGVPSGGGTRHVVLSGGEPMLQADAALVRALRNAGFFVAMETNGTLPLSGAFLCPKTGTMAAPDWITVSPKLPDHAIEIEYCHEVKLVVPDYVPDDYPRLVARCVSTAIGGAHFGPMLWLQPEDGPRRIEAARLAVDLTTRLPAWRVSVQTHKVLGIQ